MPIAVASPQNGTTSMSSETNRLASRPLRRPARFNASSSGVKRLPVASAYCSAPSAPCGGVLKAAPASAR